jgi:hypothetical protein
MWKATTWEKFDSAYQSAAHAFANNPGHLEYLTKFYDHLSGLRSSK